MNIELILCQSTFLMYRHELGVLCITWFSDLLSRSQIVTELRKKLFS